jgi:hypothetical protein
MLVPRFRFRRARGGFQWVAESAFEHGDVQRQFVALDRSLSVLKEFAAAVRWAERAGKIGEFAPEGDDLYGEAGRLPTDSGQFLSRARNRRSHEHAGFRAFDGAYRQAFRNWAGGTKPCKVSQPTSARRELEDGNDTGNGIKVIYHEAGIG